jgi:gluconolactonase
MALSLNPKTTALIIQDLLNDVITEGGTFAESGAPAHAKSQNMVENVKNLAAAARAAGMPVIHVHFFVDEGQPGIARNAPLFEGLIDTGAVIRGSWGATPADGLEVQDGDILIEKNCMNAFYSTKLEPTLWQLGCDGFVITGA